MDAPNLNIKVRGKKRERDLVQKMGKKIKSTGKNWERKDLGRGKR